jgi:hypothetical protein
MRSLAPHTTEYVVEDKYDSEDKALEIKNSDEFIRTSRPIYSRKNV